MPGWPGWLDVFIVVAAVAIVMQTLILGMMAFQTKTAIAKFQKIAEDMQSKINPILTRTNRILDDSETRVASIMGDAAEITRIARGQAQKVDRVFTEAVERLRIQVIRADQILTGTLEVIEDAGSTFRRGVWGPIQQASALLKGLKAGLDILRGHNHRPESEVEATRQDEELFI